MTITLTVYGRSTAAPHVRTISTGKAVCTIAQKRSTTPHTPLNSNPLNKFTRRQ
jgi:hypothetical protein